MTDPAKPATTPAPPPAKPSTQPVPPASTKPGSDAGSVDNTLPDAGKPVDPSQLPAEEPEPETVEIKGGKFILTENVLLAGVASFNMNYYGVASKDVVAAIFKAMVKAGGGCDDDEASTKPA